MIVRRWLDDDLDWLVAGVILDGKPIDRRTPRDRYGDRSYRWRHDGDRIGVHDCFVRTSRTVGGRSPEEVRHGC